MRYGYADGFILANGLIWPCGSGKYVTLEGYSREIGSPVLQIRNKASAP